MSKWMWISVLFLFPILLCPTFSYSHFSLFWLDYFSFGVPFHLMGKIISQRQVSILFFFLFFFISIAIAIFIIFFLIWNFSFIVFFFCKETKTTCISTVFCGLKQFYTLQLLFIFYTIEKKRKKNAFQSVNGKWRITRHVRVFGDHPSAANL